MLKTFTFVRMKPGIDRETFYERWCAHTRDFDLRDHPEISLNRLILFETPPPGRLISWWTTEPPRRA